LELFENQGAHPSKVWIFSRRRKEKKYGNLSWRRL